MNQICAAIARLIDRIDVMGLCLLFGPPLVFLLLIYLSK